MKHRFKEILIILFLALSLWLSFKVKSQRQELGRVQATLSQSNTQNNLLSYQLKTLQEAFSINFGLTPEPVLIPEVLSKSARGQRVVLYLKAHACSPCVMPVIHRLIDLGWHQDVFRIVSHESNKHFLGQALSDADLNNPQKVIWANDPLYPNQTTRYDGEFLLIDSKGLITGRLPLELMKEETLFAGLLESLAQGAE